MKSVTASAPGKVILFGEHAVVYGRPAIAVPVFEVSAQVTVAAHEGDLSVQAVDQGRTALFAKLPPDDPLAAIIQNTLRFLQHTDSPPKAIVSVRSTIPIAGGMGSGAAVSTAIVRALSKFLHGDLAPDDVSNLVYEVEKLHHGTPSGIDNSVIAYAMPVFFIKPHAAPFPVRAPFTIAIADTGIASPTKVAVANVRRAWQADPRTFDSLFDECGQIARQAHALIQSGDPHSLGKLMDQNHVLLQAMGVSCVELDDLVRAALSAGALGAKLSGGGRGGNMIALINPHQADHIRAALLNAGAKRVIVTQVR